MLYKKSHSVAITTTEATPDIQTINISKGILNLWVVWVTQESADYLKVRVFYHGVQVYPFTPQEAIKAWFDQVGVPDNLKIDTPPYELTVEAWNTAPSNPHEYHVHANIEPARPVKVEEGIEGLWDRVKGVVGWE